MSQMDEICKRERILFSTFKFVSEFDALLFNNLESLGYLKFFLKSNMFVDFTWNSFDEYPMGYKKGACVTKSERKSE